MKLFIKRDISDLNSSFAVFDEFGNQKYNAIFKKSKTNFRISLLDNNKNTVLKIRKVPMVGANTFAIKSDKGHLTLVLVVSKKEIYCNFYGNNWHIVGDVLKKEYQIIDVDNTIISTQNRLADAVTLNVYNPSNELYCIATALCVGFINTVDKLAVQAV